MNLPLIINLHIHCTIRLQFMIMYEGTWSHYKVLVVIVFTMLNYCLERAVNCIY